MGMPIEEFQDGYFGWLLLLEPLLNYYFGCLNVVFLFLIGCKRALTFWVLPIEDGVHVIGENRQAWYAFIFAIISHAITSYYSYYVNLWYKTLGSGLGFIALLFGIYYRMWATMVMLVFSILSNIAIIFWTRQSEPSSDLENSCN